MDAITSSARSGRRGRPSPSEIQARKAELLQVARAEFVRRGYRQTTMSDIAKAAGLTKRTLYLWHENKASLFRACVMEGAARFPKIHTEPPSLPATVLRSYLGALIDEVARPDSNAMGRLLLREAAEFPEFAPMIERGHDEYIIKPLASYLRSIGLEDPRSTMRTELLVSMILAPVHNSLLLGRKIPGKEDRHAHAHFVADFFLGHSAKSGD